MSKKTFFFAIAIYLPFLSSFVYASGLGYKEGEILVLFAPKADGSQRATLERNTIIEDIDGGEVISSYKLVPGLSLVKLPEGVKVKDVLTNFNKTTGILYAQPNYIYRAQSTFPNDSYFSNLYGLHNTGQTGGISDADIDAPEAWDIRTDANDIIMAVIDTGVDYNHPDLVANMWHNPGEIPGNGIDDDGNGYIDDIYGYDFCNNDNDPVDDYFHGTHVAGTIGAIGNNSQGVAGVCWNVKIMALKFLNNNGGGDTSTAIYCIEYAVENGAKILNNSWGGWPDEENPENDTALRNAIEAANANGVLFVAAAGNHVGFFADNDMFPVYPASFDCNNIISVMATNHSDRLWSFSKYGLNTVDLAAPGQAIFSTFPTYETDEMILWGYSTYYETISGTSMAAPHVAGACALLWSYKPYLTHLQVKERILKSVDKLTNLENLCVSGGRLNLYNALLYTPHYFTLTKQDDIPDGNSVLPGQLITYTISYDSNNHSDTEVNIVDIMPYQVDYNSSSPEGNYNDSDRTITWNIGEVSPGSNGTFTLIVKVNELAEPCSVFTNHCQLEGQLSRCFTECNTPVGAWNPGIIYVDDTPASDANTGMSWENAYVNLQDALDRASSGCGSQIWVAGGTYIPSKPTPPPLYFQLVNGVPIYGHFAGNETSIDQRNLSNPANESVIDGTDVSGLYVVRANGLASNTTLDGLSIKGATSGIKIENGTATLTVKNCTISNSSSYGINASGPNFIVADCNIYNAGRGINSTTSNFTITGCVIHNNYYGIYVTSAPASARVSNSIIRNNQNGIYAGSAAPFLISNNWIHHNTDGYNSGSGVFTWATVTLRNNTIFGNDYGINNPAKPTIHNCIIWGNDSDLANPYTSKYSASFTCFANCGNAVGTGNICGDANNPLFVDPDLNNYHLAPGSPCIDSGDPNGNYEGQSDIDDEYRVMGLRIDMGADELYQSKADFDHNDIVNFNDYAIWVNYWLYDDPDGRLDGDNDVDMDDFAMFCDDWLWIAPWSDLYQSLGPGEMGMLLESVPQPLISTETFPAETVVQEQSESLEGPMTAENIQELIDWTEDIWQSDPNLWESFGQSGYNLIMESLQQQLNE